LVTRGGRSKQTGKKGEEKKSAVHTLDQFTSVEMGGGKKHYQLTGMAPKGTKWSSPSYSNTKGEQNQKRKGVFG